MGGSREIDFGRLREEGVALLARTAPREEILRELCAWLKRSVPHYNWVGFYLVDPARPRELVLGPYDGAPTEHVRIPFGRGICGQVALGGKTMVVQDVAQQENYLACSTAVRSEIVVPVLRGGRLVAQLDIDSHALAPFNDGDRAFLEELCGRLAPLF